MISSLIFCVFNILLIVYKSLKKSFIYSYKFILSAQMCKCFAKTLFITNSYLLFYKIFSLFTRNKWETKCNLESWHLYSPAYHFYGSYFMWPSRAKEIIIKISKFSDRGSDLLITTNMRNIAVFICLASKLFNKMSDLNNL